MEWEQPCEETDKNPSSSSSPEKHEQVIVSRTTPDRKRGMGRKHERVEEGEEELKEDGEGMGTVDPDWGNQSSEDEQEPESLPVDSPPVDSEWDEIFMTSALKVSEQSPDTNTKVGAVLVGKDKTTLSHGWNRMPKGCESFPWSREGKTIMKTKYPYVTHAVRNAVLEGLKKGAKLEGSTLYTTLFPGNECAKMIVDMDVAEVVYLSDKYKNKKFTLASKKMLRVKGVKCRCYTPKRLQKREII